MLAATVSPDATGKCGELEGIVLAGWPKLCLYSQAVELLALVTAERDYNERHFYLVCERLSERDEQIENLKADNAALTAEISAISGHLDCEADSDSILHTIREIEADKSIYKERAEALEAKLAAAEKALKAARPYVEDYDTRRHNTGVDETLTQIDAALGVRS